MRHASNSSATSKDSGVKLLLVGVAIVLAAQLWRGVPIAAAIAILAWGTALVVQPRCRWLILAAAIYAPLGLLAITAQVDLALRSPSLAWGLFAGIDSAVATTLLYSLLWQTSELIVARLAR